METSPTRLYSSATSEQPEVKVVPERARSSLYTPFSRRNKMRIEGHRGMGRHEPENTLQAFARAGEEELDGIELDVWLTKDMSVVVIHTVSIDGQYGYIAFDDGSRKLVTELTLSEIRSQKILNGNIVPLLDEVLRLAKGKICINIEFKGTDLRGAGEVLKICREHDILDQIQFSSFNWKFADALETARVALGIEKRQPFGFLTDHLDVSESYSIGKPEDGVTFGWKLIDRNRDAFPAIAKEVISRGFKLKVYFSFSHDEIYDDYDFLHALDIDTVITNEPFLMKRYFQTATLTKAN